MYETVAQRAAEIGKYISETGCTVRKAADIFGVSKSTVHKDITARLKDIDFDLFEQVERVMQKNKAERHIRGGLATKRKYELKRSALSIIQE
ncbi:MAG: sporulation transcriptional regulator SpoIIID [Clostridia bacterium]|nr:sporulation transcriptional regulator SpoIIID [Clostridia bacterium]MBQ2152815.1 sporulation transcriptional regulator SpoIIID [Clostridia bacterium]MBQ2346877.1 sporulation transcriptional regulator SpoIIID [Clostridia bacterium]